MKREQATKARATIRVAFQTKQQANAIAKALRPELLHPPGDRAAARLATRGLTISIHFVARDSTALRAIMTSCLRILAASFNVSRSMIELESPSPASESDKSGK